MRWLALVVLGVGCSEPEESEPVDAPDPGLQLGFPLPDRMLFYEVVGVDHEEGYYPEALGARCQNYEGEPFPACYDDHDGSDYLLDGAFETMDAGSSVIVAAADGVVISTNDGEYDRCHIEDFDISCDGHPIVANHVIIEHEDGLKTLYWHLMKDTVAVEEGDEVKCGDTLGLVGSSGVSSFPHLHFELQTLDGIVIDPYAGPLSQERSYWEVQDDGDGLPAAGCAE